MRKTKIDRLAEELRDIWLGGQKGGRGDPTWSGSACKLSWIALAKDVLKRERRARGRVVAWTLVVLGAEDDPIQTERRKKDIKYAPVDRRNGYRLARIVMPSERKGGAR